MMADVLISDLAALSGEIPTGMLFEGQANGASNTVRVTREQLQELIRDTIAATLVQGANVTITPNDNADTIAIAASGGGGGGAAVATHPGYVSQRWTRPARYTVGSAALAADGFLFFYPMILAEDVTIDQLGTFVSAVQGTAKGKAAIYAHDATTKRAGAKIVETAAEFDWSSSTAAGSKKAALTTATGLTAGVYWIGVLTSGTPTLAIIGNADPATAHFFGVEDSNYNIVSTAYVGISGLYTYANGLPATYPAVASSLTTNTTVPPIVAFRKQ